MELQGLTKLPELYVLRKIGKKIKICTDTVSDLCKWMIMIKKWQNRGVVHLGKVSCPRKLFIL